MMDYPIPHKSKEAFLAHRLKQNQNAGLIFERFVQQDWSSRPNKEAKKIALKDVIESSLRVDKKLLEEWLVRWKAVAEKSHAHIFSMKTDWRFVTGLGRKGPLETGFTFHRYGFPMLPGSSVKGVARAYALQWLFKRIAKDNQLDEKEGMSEFIQILDVEEADEFKKQFTQVYKKSNPEAGENLRAIFGTKAGSGRAIFFDAIPAHVPELKLDIINPHFPDYYQDTSGRTPPSNWQSPVPSYFLTVAPGQEFMFAIGCRGISDQTAQERLTMAENVLRRALEQLGAGAKTSAGYGYWRAVINDD